MTRLLFVRFALLFFFASPPLVHPSFAAATGSHEDEYVACGVEAVIDMEAVRDFALLRGLVYPRAAFAEMRMFASEVHGVEIDELVLQAHKSCEGMVMADGNPIGPRVGRGVFEASLLGSFMW